MVCDSASQFHFDKCRGKSFNLEQLVSALRDHFQTLERTKLLLREQEIMSLQSVMIKKCEGSFRVP